MPKRRADCFFGFHSDFHATADTEGIGSFTDSEKIGEFLDAVKPDFIQVDTKGHPGCASFRSEFGTVAPGLEKDHLLILREETKKRGILLFAHYSGLMDDAVCSKHPDWAVQNADGTPDARVVDTDSPYEDTVMIPQLKELAGKYGFDGAWIDGECWAVIPNYKPEFLRRFYDASGFDRVDEDPASPSAVAFRRFVRKKFTEHIEKYVNALHAEYPDFEITSNYACSDQMPQNIPDCLDFHSADVTYQLTERLTVRCFAGLGKTWDVMSWCSAGCWNSPLGGFLPSRMKHIDRICREAAMAVAQGGAFQTTVPMTQQGEIQTSEKEHVAAIGDFVRARQPFCQGSAPVRCAAIWYSDDDRTESTDHIYHTYAPVSAVCGAVLDGGLPVSVIYDHVITSDELYEYPAVIIPGMKYVSQRNRDAVLRYVEKGGSAVVYGAKACALFTEVKEISDKIIYFESGGYMHGVNGGCAVFPDGAETLFPCYENAMKKDAPAVRAAVRIRRGKGSLFCIGWDFECERRKGKEYSFVERDLLRRVLELADPKPAAYLESGLRRAELVPSEKDGKLMLSIINTTEFYCDAFGNAFDGFPALRDVAVALRCDKRPGRIFIEPEHKAAEFTYDGAYAHIRVPEVKVHVILCVE